MIRTSCLLGLCMLASAAAAGTPASRPAGQELLTSLQSTLIPLVEQVPGGQFDWGRRQVSAVGTARMSGSDPGDFAMAQRAARLLAARNLILVLAGVPGASAEAKNPYRSGRVEVDAVLRDFTETSSDFDPKTNTVSSTITIPFDGAHGVVKLCGLAMEGPPTPPAESAKIVIIDARESGYRPVLLARITRAGGRAIAIQPPIHVAAESKSLEDVLKKISAPATVIRPQAPAMHPNSIILLNDADAALAAAAPAVVIVCQPPPPAADKRPPAGAARTTAGETKN